MKVNSLRKRCRAAGKWGHRVASLAVAIGLTAGCSAETSAADDGRCGQVMCSAGSTCCDADCGVCTTTGVCEEMCVIGRCTGQLAQGDGASPRVLGIKWNGSGCQEVIGESCDGQSCRSLYRSLAECESYNEPCYP